MHLLQSVAGLATGLLWASSVAASPVELVERQTPAAWSTYTKNGVFYPSQQATSWRTLYARSLQLPDDSILITWEDYDPTVAEAYWPIYKSVDGGASFQNFSRVHDQVNGWGAWYQPFLFTLPQAMGKYAAGTVLMAGVSTPRNLSSAYIDLYASTDGAATWSFVSHIVYGAGPETVTNGDKAVWEPFLMMYDGQLVCYYSSQTDASYAQKLAHKTTKDLSSWSAEVNDVAMPTYSQRPGMATVAYSPKSALYVLTFEYCGGPISSGCPVYFKTATNPLQFQSATAHPILPNGGSSNPNGSPYVIWVPAPNATDGSGLFIANGSSREEIFLNTDAVDPNGWRAVNVGQWSAYSRSLRLVSTPAMSPAHGRSMLFIANGGNIGCSGNCYNYVADALVPVPSYPSS